MEERAADVDRHHAVPFLLGRVDDRLPDDLPGVVDEDVDPLPARERCLDGPTRRVGGRCVALDREDASSSAISWTVGTMSTAITRAPRSRRSAVVTRADPARCAGHDRHPAFERLRRRRHRTTILRTSCARKNNGSTGLASISTGVSSRVLRSTSWSSGRSRLPHRRSADRRNLRRSRYSPVERLRQRRVDRPGPTKGVMYGRWPPTASAETPTTWPEGPSRASCRSVPGAAGLPGVLGRCRRRRDPLAQRLGRPRRCRGRQRGCSCSGR